MWPQQQLLLSLLAEQQEESWSSSSRGPAVMRKQLLAPQVGLLSSVTRPLHPWQCCRVHHHHHHQQQKQQQQHQQQRPCPRSTRWRQLPWQHPSALQWWMQQQRQLARSSR
jgi:hypothetical protein